MARFYLVLMAAVAATTPVSLAAQQSPTTVSAANPDGIVRALRFGGYDAELTTDSVGDPMIETEFGGMTGRVVFYGCDEDTHRECDSVQLRVGLDRAEPMTAQRLVRDFGNDRYYGVQLDDEGDPWFSWDIVTGNGAGIPTPVFMLAVNRYSTQISNAADEVFAEERGR